MKFKEKDGTLVTLDEVAPSRDLDALITRYLFGGEGPVEVWVKDMNTSWSIVDRFADLFEEDNGVIGSFSGPDAVPANVRKSSFLGCKDKDIPDDVKDERLWFCSFCTPAKEDDPLAKKIRHFEFFSERPELAIYAAAVKASELLRDGRPKPGKN